MDKALENLVFRRGKTISEYLKQGFEEGLVLYTSSDIEAAYTKGKSHNPTQTQQGDTSTQSLGESEAGKASANTKVEGSEATSVSLADGETSPSVNHNPDHADRGIAILGAQEGNGNEGSSSDPTSGSIDATRTQRVQPAESRQNKPEDNVGAGMIVHDTPDAESSAVKVGDQILCSNSGKVRSGMAETAVTIQKYADTPLYKPMLISTPTKTHAIFISTTNNRGRKNRWQCPKCKDNPLMGESRFNLSTEKVNCAHKCRFCGTELWLEVGK